MITKNVKVYKLLSGEEVLAEGDIASDLDEATFSLKNPVAIIVTADERGQPRVGFVPFPLHSGNKRTKDFYLPKSSVAYTYVPDPEFLKSYDQIFGQGIVVPTQKLILG